MLASEDQLRDNGQLNENHDPSILTKQDLIIYTYDQNLDSSSGHYKFYT